MVHGVYENERVFTNNGKDRQSYNFVALKKECHDMSSLQCNCLRDARQILRKGISNSHL